jgi:hypothetical protein
MTDLKMCKQVQSRMIGKKTGRRVGPTYLEWVPIEPQPCCNLCQHGFSNGLFFFCNHPKMDWLDCDILDHMEFACNKWEVKK